MGIIEKGLAITIVLISLAVIAYVGYNKTSVTKYTTIEHTRSVETNESAR